MGTARGVSAEGGGVIVVWEGLAGVWKAEKVGVRVSLEHGLDQRHGCG